VGLWLVGIGGCACNGVTEIPFGLLVRCAAPPKVFFVQWCSRNPPPRGFLHGQNHDTCPAEWRGGWAQYHAILRPDTAGANGGGGPGWRNSGVSNMFFAWHEVQNDNGPTCAVSYSGAGNIFESFAKHHGRMSQAFRFENKREAFDELGGGQWHTRTRQG